MQESMPLFDRRSKKREPKRLTSSSSKSRAGIWYHVTSAPSRTAMIGSTPVGVSRCEAYSSSVSAGIVLVIDSDARLLGIATDGDLRRVLAGHANLETEMDTRIETEKALHISEKKFEDLYDNTPAVYMKLNAKGHIISVNRFGAYLLGYERTELIRQSVIDLYCREDRNLARQYIRETIDDPKRLHRWELHKQAKNGDVLLMRGLREGKSSKRLSRELLQYLLPAEAGRLTRKPYGTYVSYSGMRLARTEITRAANQAAYISGYTNPYTDGIDVARSLNGDIECALCPPHATINIYGDRVRPPYRYDEAVIPPEITHPHCMCHMRPALVENPAVVSAQIREVMNDPGAPWPMTTPANSNFVFQLLGQALMLRLSPVTWYLQTTIRRILSV